MEGVFKDIILFSSYLKEGRVLDFGVGSGYTSTLLAQLGFGVDAVDIKTFEIEKRLYDTASVDQPKIWRALEDVYRKLKFNYYEKDLPFEDNSFDGIMAYAVLEHIKDNDIDNVMKELSRVIKPNGILFIARLPQKLSYSECLSGILKFNHHDKLYNINEAKELLYKYNFKILDYSYDDFVINNPLAITNRLYPLLSIVNKIALLTPLKYIAHNLTIVARKENNGN